MGWQKTTILSKNSEPPTATIREAGNSSLVDRVQLLEMSVPKRTFPDKSPARHKTNDTLTIIEKSQLNRKNINRIS